MPRLYPGLMHPQKVALGWLHPQTLGFHEGSLSLCIIASDGPQAARRRAEAPSRAYLTVWGAPRKVFVFVYTVFYSGLQSLLPFLQVNPKLLYRESDWWYVGLVVQKSGKQGTVSYSEGW